MNNKGFIISTILYTILVAFLLFLGVTLAVFSSATTTIGGGTDDLVNATFLSINPVNELDSDGNVIVNIPWYKTNNNVLVKVSSKYGEFYWPKDFGTEIDDDGNISNKNSRIDEETYEEVKESFRNNLVVKCTQSTIELKVYDEIKNLGPCNETLGNLTDDQYINLYVIDTSLKTFSVTGLGPSLFK